MQKTFLTTAAALTLISFAVHAEGKTKKEKCYGVVKAGKNDCGSFNRTHACSGYAKTDGSKNEWIYLTKGECKRLVNGSLIGGITPDTRQPGECQNPGKKPAR